MEQNYKDKDKAKKERNNTMKIIDHMQKDAINDIKFLINAIDKKTTREALKYILAEDGKLIATDGKRMHITSNDNIELPNGVYEIKKTGKDYILLNKDEINYPKWKQACPKDENITYRERYNVPHDIECEIIKAISEYINIDYLRDALRSMDEIVEYGEYSCILVIKSANKKAVIMQRSIDNGKI